MDKSPPISSAKLSRGDAISLSAAAREALRLSEESRRRKLRAFVVSAIAFELIVRSAATEVTIAGIKLNDLTAAELLLPVLMAYLLLQITLDFIHTIHTYKAHRRLLSTAIPDYVEPQELSPPVFASIATIHKLSPKAGGTLLIGTILASFGVFVGASIVIGRATHLAWERSEVMAFAGASAATTAVFWLVAVATLLASMAGLAKSRDYNE